MNLSCKEATRLMSQSQDRELSLGERTALKLHVAVCRGCRAVSQQLEFLRRAVRRMAERE